MSTASFVWFSNLAEPAAAVLFDAAFKGALLLGLAMLVVRAMRRASAAARHLVLLVTVIGLSALPLLSAALPGWRILPETFDIRIVARHGTAEGTVREAPKLAPSRALPATSTSQTRRPASGFSPPVGLSVEAHTRKGPLTPGEARVRQTRSHGEAAGPSYRVMAWFVGVWLGGACFVLAANLLAWLSLRRLEHRSIEVGDGPLRRSLDEMRLRLGIRRPVKLLSSTSRSMPMTWGSLRPRLLLPDEFHEWPADRRSAVLAHELAHIERCDFAALLLTRVATALHWFNPLAWLAARRMAAECERACDDLVLCAGFRAWQYAEELLYVTRLGTRRGTGAAAIAMARQSAIEGRIRAVLDPALNRRRLSRRAVLLAVLLACGICLPLAVVRPAVAPQERAPDSGQKPTKQAPDADREAKPRPDVRVLRFPVDRVMGVVYTRPWRSDGYDVGKKYEGWSRKGEARGEIRVAADADVRLDVGNAASADLSPLGQLAADDVQSLWLHETQVDDDGLRHVGRLTGLVYLDLEETRITDEGVKHLAGLVNLQEVQLSAFRVHRDGFGVGDEAVAILAELPALEQINLRLTKVTDAGLAELGKMKRLKSLSLAGTRVTDAGLAALEGLATLEYLTLGGYKGEGTAVTDAGLIHLARLTNLKWLTLSDTKITDAGLVHLGQLDQLEYLALNDTAITEAGLGELQPLKALKTLSIPDDITDVGAEHLSRLRSLEGISSNFYHITDAGLAHLAQLKHLERLSLASEGVTDEGMRHLANATSLKILWLQDCPITDDGLAKLASLKALENLMLTRARVTGQGLRHLQELPKLDTLMLEFDEPIDVRHVGQLDALKALDLLGASFSNDSLGDFAQLRQLEDLELRGFVVNDAGIRHVARLVSLKHLSIEESTMTDDGLAEIAKLQGLESLTVSAPITDAGLAHLTSLRSLSRLQIASPFVIDEGIAALKQELPSLQSVNRFQYRMAYSEASFSDRDGFLRQGEKESRVVQDALESQLAPPLQVEGWLNTGETPLTLEALKGKVVLLDFWGVWCGPCIAFMPELRAVHERHKEDGLVLISVHTTHDAEKMAAFVKEQGYGWPIAADVEEQTVTAFAVNSYPGLYLIDRKGTLRIADIHRADLDKAVATLLAE